LWACFKRSKTLKPQSKGCDVAGKCEHGLTTRECYVCASPKYAIQPLSPQPITGFLRAMDLALLNAEADCRDGVLTTAALRDLARRYAERVEVERNERTTQP
jgi:hypothetical protein